MVKPGPGFQGNLGMESLAFLAMKLFHYLISGPDKIYFKTDAMMSVISSLYLPYPAHWGKGYPLFIRMKYALYMYVRSHILLCLIHCGLKNVSILNNLA